MLKLTQIIVKHKRKKKIQQLKDRGVVPHCFGDYPCKGPNAQDSLCNDNEREFCYDYTFNSH